MLLEPELPVVLGKIRSERIQLGLKLVVRMPHCGRTSLGTVQTPKKAAVALVFCFPNPLLTRKLASHEFLQSINACHSDLRQSDWIFKR